MKKVVFSVLMASAFAAQAADVGLSVGTDRKFNKDFTVLSVGTDVMGLKASVDVGRVQDTYHSVGVSVGKSLNVFGLGVLPYTSLSYIKADSTKLEDGGVGSAGLEVSYALSKSVSVTADYSYRWDLKKSTSYEGSLVTFGLKSTF